MRPAPNTPDMKRTVVINQPTYLPWLGYFEQIARADVFVFLDSVQFSRQSWQCRNRLEGPVNGETPWLNVPVARQPLSTVIRDIRIAPERADWAQLHLDAITARLGRAPFFREMLATVEPVLRSSPTHLAELNITLIRAIAARLGLEPQFLRSSDLPVTGTKAELVVNLLKHVGATDYYASAGSAVYLEAARPDFTAAGVELSYQAWEHPRYAQGDGAFVSHLSVVDALSWIGFEGVARLLARQLQEAAA